MHITKCQFYYHDKCPAIIKNTNTVPIVFTARRYASTVYTVVVSVCLSVTSRHCTKMAKHRILQTTPDDSLGTSFQTLRDSTKF